MHEQSVVESLAMLCAKRKFHLLASNILLFRNQTHIELRKNNWNAKPSRNSA